MYDEKMILEMFGEAVKQETAWTNHIIGNDIPGITEKTTDLYTKWLANTRLLGLNLDPLYPEVTTNPYKHLEAMADNNSEKTNFFESTVTNYTQSSSMNGSWDF
jgi:ribonucleoside-diphosphate reductase beta chain